MFNEAGYHVEVPYDLLVGADGAGSSVRELLLSKVPGYKVDITDSGRAYKVYLNLQGDIEPEGWGVSGGEGLGGIVCVG